MMIAIPYIPTTRAKSTSAVPYWLVAAPGTLVARMKRWYGSAMTGWNSEVGRNRDEKTTAVNMIGAVSPAALPIQRIAPVTIPGTAGGRTTLLIVCHRVAPSARLPSRNVCGMVFNDSSVVRMTVGRIISARVICPASNDTPTLRKRTMKANPNNPKTMEGVPLSRSTPVLMSRVMRPSLVYSTR